MASAQLIPHEPQPSSTPSTTTPNTAPRNLPIRTIQPLDLPYLTALRQKRIILASASPRRRQLLAQIGLTNIEVIPSTFPEDLSKSGTAPFDYVLDTATHKCMQVYKDEIIKPGLEEPALVIAADTIVVAPDGTILEKPRSVKEHVEMLRLLRNFGKHTVYTAVVLMAPLETATPPGYKLETHVEETVVRFDRAVTDELIVSYVKTREGVDKAGGYGIQGIGAVLVEGIEGSYDNVVGLPVRATLMLIEKIMLPEEDEEELVGSGEED